MPVAAVLAVAVVLASCGGGGGGGSTPEPPSGSASSPSTGSGQSAQGQWLTTSVQVERDVFAQTTERNVIASLSLRAPGVAYWFRYRFQRGLVANTVGYTFRTADDGIDFRLDLRTPFETPPGTYDDSLQVDICLDEACTRPIPGSPFQLPLRLTVAYLASPEPGFDLVVPNASTALAHDVVAAAYSVALDAVVMVSQVPSATVRVFDLASGSTRSISLLTLPTSLSLSPDGLRLAVGHDAAVSLVDLRAAATEPVRRFEMPLAVGAVVLDSRQRIYAFGNQQFARNGMAWVDTNVAQAVGRATAITAYGTARPLLHPSGDRLYMADSGLSPDDVRVLDLGAAGPGLLTDSRYHGEHTFCGRVLPSADGTRLFTGCGVVLRSSAVIADDMVYAGTMSLSPRGLGSFQAVALSEAPGGASISLMEQDIVACDPRFSTESPCFTRLATYDTMTLQRTSHLSLGPHQRGNERLAQDGRFLMHRRDGSRLLISQLRTKGEATASFVLHRLP